MYLRPSALSAVSHAMDCDAPIQHPASSIELTPPV
jgi:hypothetical protein